jgi:serine protease Do
MHKKIAPALIAACLAAAAPQVHADAGENVFREALRYTVQVRTAVPLPFDTDQQGTQRGAGFVIDAQRGWIMTNAHVVSRSPSRVEVAAHGRSYVAARKLYVDPHLDLALIEIPAAARAGLGEARLDCNDAPSVGHPVGAFGHPWNLSFTGTRGIVSGTTVRRYTEFMQTDAPINAGNSGGPLISLETGEVVGINTAQIRGSQNTNFVVSMHYACRIVDLLKAGKDPSPPDLHVVYYRESDDEHVLKVARNYHQGGLDLRTGDIIREVLGVHGPITNETHLFDALRGRLDGFTLRVERDGVERLVSGRAQPMDSALSMSGVLSAGVLFGPANFVDSEEMRTGALMIHHVEMGSEGQAKDLYTGDFLELVNGNPVASLQDLQRMLNDAAGGTVTLTLKRYIGAERVFSYMERRLRVEGVQWVGPASPGSAVAREPEIHPAPVTTSAAGS